MVRSCCSFFVLAPTPSLPAFLFARPCTTSPSGSGCVLLGRGACLGRVDESRFIVRVAGARARFVRQKIQDVVALEVGYLVCVKPFAANKATHVRPASVGWHDGTDCCCMLKFAGARVAIRNDRSRRKQAARLALGTSQDRRGRGDSADDVEAGAKEERDQMALPHRSGTMTCVTPSASTWRWTWLSTGSPAPGSATTCPLA